MNCFKDLIRTLENSLKSIDKTMYKLLIDECESTLRSKHKIIVSGLGKNVPVCDKFVGTMLSLGLNAGFLHTNSAVHGDMGMIKEGDLVIILTKSGETLESVYLADLLLDRNIILWLLSFNHESTLSRKISRHLILDLETEGDPWNIIPNNSTILNLIILQNIAMTLLERLDITIDEFKKNHPGGNIGHQLRQTNE